MKMLLSNDELHVLGTLVLILAKKKNNKTSEMNQGWVFKKAGIFSHCFIRSLL